MRWLALLLLLAACKKPKSDKPPPAPEAVIVGEAGPEKLQADAPPAPSSSELDAALAKLGAYARTAPKSAPACAGVKLPMDELTAVEAVDLAQLLAWAGDPPKPAVISTKLFTDVIAFQTSRIGDPAKLRERIDTTRYVIALRIDKISTEATALVLEPSTGSWLCSFPVHAKRDQISKAFPETVKRAFPKLELQF
jgi:hypothetical protein